jgi:hypothetical protein
MGLLRMILRGGSVDDATLLLLAKYGPPLRDHSARWDCYRLPAVIVDSLTERKGPIGRELGESLAALVRHLERLPDHNDATFRIAFRLFREGFYPIPWRGLAAFDGFGRPGIGG